MDILAQECFAPLDGQGGEEEAIKDLKSARAQQPRLPVAYFIRVCNKTHIRSDIYESGVIQPITGRPGEREKREGGRWMAGGSKQAYS